MAPLPQNSTPTYWLEYTSEGRSHEMQFRLPVGSTTADGLALANAIVTALKPYMPTTDSFRGLRYRQAGANVSFNIPFLAVAGTNASQIVAGEDPNFMSLTGRSPDGRDARMTFFTPFARPNERYRWNSGENVYADNWRLALLDSEPPVVSVSGQEVNWNSYVNNGRNAYVQRKKRRTG